MYDAALRPGAALKSYAEEFTTVENDSTFYGTPAPERVLKWASAVPAGFTFSNKMVRTVTHERRMTGVEDEIREFYAAMRSFGDKLGCVLFQFDATFSRDEEPAFWRGLDAVPAGVRTAVEFRDPAWYDAEVQARLEARGIALALCDAPFVPRDALAAALARQTLDFAYVRWVGAHDAFTRFDAVQCARDGEIAWWARELREAAPRLRTVHGYVNNHYQGHSPATVRALYQALGIAHERPRRIEQRSLFG
jgi:uncharacterized protein YecE (DUF72 family)